eukprot:CAMPEP_0184544522 /NCGR_PEP_ID=MMETSP0199_2-20130426/3676_1 /TAXON_ID=1112570 /ORGANISM="Thraustochytrium sp., Strain LLF1b" /LENGTH=555 /DNA_ID=CAMNT_0026938707 /DNA_START=36 /DNA_END=1703 /DNA_ORIENTATION=-
MSKDESGTNGKIDAGRSGTGGTKNPGQISPPLLRCGKCGTDITNGHGASSQTKCCSCLCCRWCLYFIVVAVMIIIGILGMHALDALVLVALEFSEDDELGVATPAVLTDTLEGIHNVLMDLAHPERWVGSDFLVLWDELKKATEQASLHFQDTPMPPLYKLIPLIASHLVYIEEHRQNATLTWNSLEGDECRNISPRRIEKIRYHAKFASLAYAPPTRIRTTLAVDGFKLLQWESTVEYTKPSYFVAMNAKRKTAIVAIRGTSSLQDVLTDIIHTPVPFVNGSFAHSGMLQAARFVVNRTAPIISDLFHPLGYEVTIVGHSLAAGAATLATIIFQHEYKMKIRCFAFAPPPVLDRDSKDMANGFVDAMIHNDDVIPRFNFGVLAATFGVLYKYIEQIEKQGLTIAEFYAEHSFDERMKVLHDEIETNTRDKIKRDMFVSGRIAYFTDSSQGYIYQEVPNEFPSLRRFEITRRQLSDHSMVQHLIALDQVLQNGKKHSQVPSHQNPFLSENEVEAENCLGSGLLLAYKAIVEAKSSDLSTEDSDFLEDSGEDPVEL